MTEEVNVSRRGLGMVNPHRTPVLFDLLQYYGIVSRPNYAPVMDEPARKEGENPYSLVRKDRKQLYRVYDDMDTYGLVSAILDVYAEETTQPDFRTERVVWSAARKSSVAEEVDACLQALSIDDRMFGLTRVMCKYGEAARLPTYKTGLGVVSWQPVHPSRVERIHDKLNRLRGFKVDGVAFKSGAADVGQPWDVAHFRLLSSDEQDVYGTSILRGMIRPWRQLVIGEDQVLQYRVQKSPDRNLIQFDPGELSDDQAYSIAETLRKKFRKSELVDPLSADYMARWNPLSPLDDIFLPSRADMPVSVNTLSGAGNADQLYDMQMFYRNFFGSAKVPKAYFGYEGEINAKSSLSQQDIRFARTGKRIRRSQIWGLRSVTDLHLHLRGFDLSDPDNAYVLKMAPVSFLDEFERAELEKMRLEVMNELAQLGATLKVDPMAWTAYILVDVGRMPQDHALRLLSKPGEPPVTEDALGRLRHQAGQAFAGSKDLLERSRGVFESIDRFFRRYEVSADSEEFLAQSRAQVDPTTSYMSHVDADGKVQKIDESYFDKFDYAAHKKRLDEQAAGSGGRVEEARR